MTDGPTGDPPSRFAGQAPDTSAPAVGQVRPGLYDVDPDTIAALVLGCPAVAGLSSGPFGGAATYLPGRTVPGVQIAPDVVEVHVVTWYGAAVTELARQVRQALTGHVQGRTVDIVVEDIADPNNLDDADRDLSTPPAWARRAPGGQLLEPAGSAPARAGLPGLGTPVPPEPSAGLGFGGQDVSRPPTGAPGTTPLVTSTPVSNSPSLVAPARPVGTFGRRWGTGLP